MKSTILLCAAILLTGLLSACMTLPQSGRSANALLAETQAPLTKGKLEERCDFSRRALGVEIDTYRVGGRRYRLYDENPEGKGLRVFSLIGAKGGCALQTRAAGAMFGSVASYEMLRYHLKSRSFRSGPTDKAYDRLKTKICGVSAKVSCGAKLENLSKKAVFVNFYDQSTTATKWTSALLSGGRLIKAGRKE